MLVSRREGEGCRMESVTLLEIAALAVLLTDSRPDFRDSVGTEFRGDAQEFLTVRIAALSFIKTARWITGPGDNGRAGEHVMHDRSRLGAIEQAGTRLGCQTKDH
jgi:hypothetical protein